MAKKAGNTIAQAYVQILPTTEGIKKDLTSALSDPAASAGEEAGSRMGSGMQKGLGVMAKAGVAAISAASTAMVAITKSAIDSYADFEQLSGGIETLFGSSAAKVMANADAAFKTAGMSANEYMETTIQSAAAMINSLGGDQKKAAELMDLSITDMADNVNKMGTSMQSVQDAYRGFSRGNFTMLDNLALGFAGTKEGMQQLLDKAKELSGVEYDINSYSDIVQAIHVVQTEMGITGTTAKEASETISGSISTMKSAWSNLVTGMANENANFGSLVDNLVESVSTVGKNLMPRISQALQGIGKLVEGLAPVIAAALPPLITEILPVLLTSAASLVQTIGDAILQNLPALIDCGLQIIMTLADSLIAALPELIPAIVDIVLEIVDKLTDPDTITQLLDAALRIILALAEGLMKAAPKLIAKAPEIIMNLVTALLQAAPQLLQAGLQMMMIYAEGIANGIASVVKSVGDLARQIKQKFEELRNQARQWGRDLIQKFIDGLKEKIEALKGTVKNIANAVKRMLGFSEPEEGPLSDFHTYAPDMMRLFAKGIRDNEQLVRDQIARSLSFGDAIASGGLGAAKAVAAAGSSGSSPASQPIQITLISQLDGTELARRMYTFNLNEANRRGMSLINA